MHENFICKKYRLYDYLVKRGYKPKEILTDPKNPDKNWWLFELNDDLNEVLALYFYTNKYKEDFDEERRSLVFELCCTNNEYAILYSKKVFIEAYQYMNIRPTTTISSLIYYVTQKVMSREEMSKTLKDNKDGLFTYEDILNQIKDTKAQLMGVNTKTTKERIAIIDLNIEVENIEELNKVIRTIKKVDSVYEVRR